MRTILTLIASLFIIGCGKTNIFSIPDQPVIEEEITYAEIIDSIEYKVFDDDNTYLRNHHTLMATDIAYNDTFIRIIHNSTFDNISKSYEFKYDSTKGDTTIIDLSKLNATYTYIWSKGYLVEWKYIRNWPENTEKEIERHTYRYNDGRIALEQIYSYGSWIHTIEATYYTHTDSSTIVN